MLTSAPPELPGLIAASVWMASSTVFWLPVSPVVDTGRLSALTMPVVTVPARPSGEPTAITGWPTRRLADDPRLIGVSPDTPCTRTTAMSVVGSAPTTVNGAVRPSENVTVVFGLPLPGGGRADRDPGRGTRVLVGALMFGAGRLCGAGALPGLAAVATTWLLVRIRPSEDRMMPEPSSDCPTEIGLQHDDAGHHLGGDLLDAAERRVRGRHAGSRTAGHAHRRRRRRACPWCAITDAAAPPIPADTTAIATAPTVNAPARERFRGTASGGGGPPPEGRPATGERAVGRPVLPAGCWP